MPLAHYRLNVSTIPAGDAKRMLRDISTGETTVTTPDSSGVYEVTFSDAQDAKRFELALTRRDIRIDRREAPSSSRVDSAKSGSTFWDSFGDGVVFGVVEAIVDALFDW